MKTLFLVIPLLFVFLSGCTPSTAGGVRDMGPDRRYSFTVPENYQPVYRKILSQERKCKQAGWIASQWVVQGDLYHDTKSGQITLELHGATGVNVYDVVDVEFIDDKNTRVTAYFPFGPAEKFGRIIQEWVLEDSKECGLKNG